jgi:hypothetical protein
VLFLLKLSQHAKKASHCDVEKEKIKEIDKEKEIKS